MKHTILASIMIMIYISQSVGMETAVPTAPTDEVKEAGQPPVPPELKPEPPLYPPTLEPQQQPPPDLNAGEQKDTANQSLYLRMHGFLDRSTYIVGAIVTTPLTDLPIIHTAYKNFPVTTKLALLGITAFFISRTHFFQTVVNKASEAINNLIGNSSDIDDDDDEEDDDEVNKHVYNNELLTKI